MNKRAFLKAYQDVKKLAPEHQAEPLSTETDKPKIYRSAEDEELIKSYHYAKFQKNLDQAKHHSDLKALVEKEEWDDEDTKKLLSMLR